MRLQSEFIRLPLKYDVDRLIEEAHQFSEYEWENHPLHYDGNTALSLVSQGGTASNATSGGMAATAALGRAPYVQQVMASFNTVIGRSRFMRLAPGSHVPQHADTEYAWRNRVRIHIPVITDPAILFSSFDMAKGTSVDVHMAAGEAWIFDNWREHAVINDTDVRRIHLVVDTVGSAEFWQLAAHGWDPKLPKDEWSSGISTVAYQADAATQLSFEQYTSAPVRSPDEIESIQRELLVELEHLRDRAPFTFQEIDSAILKFSEEWRAYWSLYCDNAEHIHLYQSLVSRLKEKLKPRLANISLKTNRVAAYDVVAKWLDATTDASVVRRHNKTEANSRLAKVINEERLADRVPDFSEVTFIVAAPRAGGAMLFEALRRNKKLWSIGDAMQQELESLSVLKTLFDEQSGDQINANLASESLKNELHTALLPRLQNSAFASYCALPPELQVNNLHFLEFSPKNALRIGFLKGLFPNAKFIYLYREAHANIASMMEAWESQRYISHAQLADWPGLRWSLPLIPGWQKLRGRNVAEIAAAQWSSINDSIMDDLGGLLSKRFTMMSYEQLLSQPLIELSRLCEFANIPFGPKMRTLAEEGLPRSRYILTEPKQGKWEQRLAEIAPVTNVFTETDTRLRDLKSLGMS